MARKGGYTRSNPNVEWTGIFRGLYGEAIVSAQQMGQTLEVWMNDAVAHHIYRCELVQCQQRLHEDELAAQRAMRPSPVASDPQYQPTRPKPTITRPGQAGQGAGPSRAPRPRG